MSAGTQSPAPLSASSALKTKLQPAATPHSTSGTGRQFLMVLLQFALIVLVVNHWDVEGLALARVMQLAFIGFIIHHFLPVAWRLPFFGMLSIATTVVVLGEIGPQTLAGWITGKIPLSDCAYRLAPGVTLIGIGFGLIGICHLPVPLWLRIGLLAGAGIGLSFVRANTHWFPDVTGIWVILGSMFVFRLMVYMYDLKNKTAPFSFARSVSYFFMLPNVCFPLFPLVDYKAFCTTYFNEERIRIYQSGLVWMLRGAFQLLLYQAVYQFAPLDVAKLSSTLGVAGFMLATYLLYLHVSGQFHLIVGLLHMFGFNLPETHHFFLLASSFTDFWRRINIYWKDFIMRLFFYPSFFAMRQMGTLKAMALATLVTFFLTWLLHSWQWFWIRGSFLFTWQDISFWTILALLVLVNALYEATRGRQRKLTPSKITLKERAIVGLKTIGTFLVICTLWTLWSCQSADELRTLADAAAKPRLIEVVIIVALLGGLGICGMIWGHSSRETSEGKAAANARAPFHFWRSSGAVAAGAACLLALPSLAMRLNPETERWVAQLRHDALNARDLKMQRRGYYEELDTARSNTARVRKVEKPADWNASVKVLYRDRPDFLMKELAPSQSVILCGVPTSSSSLGMRDREYQPEKPAGTYRAVLVGASHELGSGVKDDETFENLVEDRLNRELGTATQRRFEILNMAMGGDCVLQKLMRLEKGFAYQPDAALFTIFAEDRQLLLRFVRRALTLQLEPPAEYREFLNRITAKAGVNAQMPDVMIERRLLPHIDEMYQWIFSRVADECGKRAITPIALYRPAPIDFEGIEEREHQQMLKLARAAGLKVIDLSPAFESVADRRTIVLAKWDDHTNVQGHRLLAEHLFKGLTPLISAAP